jgi:hypothetical protein
MKRKWIVSAVVLMASFALTSGVSSAKIWGQRKPTNQSAGVAFSSVVRLPGGALLEPGSYKMQLVNESTSPEVEFYKDGRLVARSQAKVVSESQKNKLTSVCTDRSADGAILTEIRPAGWNKRVVFAASGETSEAGL